MGPYAGVDSTLTLRPLQSRLQHIKNGQPYARVDFIAQSGTANLAYVVLDPTGCNTGSPATDPAPGPALACPGNRLR